MTTPSYIIAATTTTPTEPVTLAEAKAFLRVTYEQDDALISEMITSAREYCERAIGGGRSIATKQWYYYLPEFPAGRIDIPRPPLKQIDAISYYNTSNQSTVLSTTKITKIMPTESQGWIEPIYNTTWPVAATRADAIRITFTGGYATVPSTIKQAIKMLVAHWYENREAMLVGTVAQEMGLAVTRLLGINSYGYYA